MLPDDTSVLITGGGPFGLMLANELGRRGVAVLLVDQKDGTTLFRSFSFGCGMPAWPTATAAIFRLPSRTSPTQPALLPSTSTARSRSCGAMA